MPDISPYTGTLGNRLAAHLLRRTTYGPTKAQILEYAARTPQQAVDILFTFAPVTNKPIDPALPLAASWVELDGALPPGSTDDVGLRGYVFTWFMDEMRKDTTARSKMTWFLHQNWIVNDEAWKSADIYDYIKLLEFYSMGSYKDLAKKMSADLRMGVYLNGVGNVASNPNENYAREFLELFTIGKGPQIAAGDYTFYKETDVQQAAKIFSGWTYWFTNTNVDSVTGLRRCNPVVNRHSTVNKTLSSAFDNAVITGRNTTTGMAQEISDFVNVVFGKIATAKNIARKLYRFFVGRNITAAIETDIITPMADTLFANNYNIALAAKQLLASRHFYDQDDANTGDNRIGAIVKSPMELMFQTVKFFGISPHTQSGADAYSIWRDFYRESLLYGFFPNCDFHFFNAPTVAGYPADYIAPKFDRYWFDGSSLTQRYFLGKVLLEGKIHPFQSWKNLGKANSGFDIVNWVRFNISNPSNAETIVDEMVNFLLPEIPTVTRRNYFVSQVLGTLSLANWATEWATYVSSGHTNVTAVKPRLEKLFKAILFSQEYQLK